MTLARTIIVSVLVLLCVCVASGLLVKHARTRARKASLDQLLSEASAGDLDSVRGLVIYYAMHDPDGEAHLRWLRNAVELGDEYLAHSYEYELEKRADPNFVPRKPLKYIKHQRNDF